MIAFGSFLGTVIVLYVIFLRGLPRLLSWIASKLLKCELKIGHIGLFPPSLKNLQIRRDEATVIIDSLGISSSLVNSKYGKLVAVYMSDVRIQRDPKRRDPRRRQEPPVPKSTHVPPHLLTLLQIASVHIYNLNVIVYKTFENCLAHASATEVKIEGATHHPHLQIIFGIDNFTGKALRHIEETNTSQPCLAEVNFSSEVSVSLDPRDNWRIKGVNFSVQPVLDIRFTEGILAFLSKPSEQRTSQTSPSTSDGTNVDGPNSKLALFLPQELQISFGNSSIKFTSDGPPRTSLTFSVSRASLEVNSLRETWESFTRTESSAVPRDMSTVFVLDQLSLSCEQLQLLAVEKCTLSILADGKMADINLDLLTFSAYYHHEKFWPWLAKMAKKRHTTPLRNAPPTLRITNPGLLSRYSAKVTVEVRNASCWLQMGPAPRCGTGIRRAKLQGHASPETRTVDVVVESWWCRLGDIPYPDNPIKKQHYWNTPMFVSVLLVKARDEPDIGYRKLEAMVDGVQAEWCPKLRLFLKESGSCVDEWKATLSSWRSGKIQGLPSRGQNITKKSISITVTGTNVFATGERNVGMMLRVDSGSAESDGQKISVSLEGMKLAPLALSGQHTMCSKCNEMTEYTVQVSRCNVRFDAANRSLWLLLSDEVTINWNASDHLMACEVLSDLKDVRSKEPRQQGNRPFLSSFEFSINGAARLAAKLSCTRRLEVGMKGFCGTWRSPATSSVNCDEICVCCDGHNIATLHKIVVEGVEDGGASMREDRGNFEELTAKWNRAWIVSMDTVHISFPDRYNFAEAFTEQTMGVVKWLKMLHRTTGERVNEALPADSLVKIRELVIVLEDDAFEAKLRDNYVLLEDEYNESLKRWKMLNVKLDELRKTHLLLPAGKVEELFSSLLKKNADIYLRRWRQMYGGRSLKTRLFTSRFEGLEILVMADPDFHGKDRIIHHMRVIDPQSPYPEEGLLFSTLWCRMVRVTASVINCHLRDYPAPCLNVQNLLCWGKLVGAEQEANHRGKRTTVIELNRPWTHATVERNMSPLKFFHDFSCDAERLTMGYGPCWEPAVAQYGLAADLVSRPSIDPSPPLPFWDKMRLIFHGRLTLMVQQLTLVLHASHDPYNTTEQMDFSWSDLIMDWTNAKFVLKGNLDVHVRTASKYDDCRLLHFPNLKLSVKLDWQCLGDPNDHHAVRPCAPDKLPEYSSNQEHDSYRAFRSLNLNLSISMETKSSNATDQENIPSMLFYNSTLRWLDNLQSIVKNVTRPIRRGPLFQNLKPKKPSLSRHYKFLRFSIALHRLKLCYWSSFAKQRGFQLEAGKLTMSSEHNLNMITLDDGLKHRPFAEWTTAYMNCELNDGDMWLQSIGLASDDSTTELNVYYNAPVEKSFFLSLTRLSYGREAPGSQDTPTHRLVIHDLQGAWTKNNRAIAFSLFDSFMKNQLTRHNLSTEALKGFRADSSSSPTKSRKGSSSILAPPQSSSSPGGAGASPMTRIQSGQAIHMLQKLISEADSNAVVFSEDLPGSAREQLLHGVAACQSEDVLQQNWLVELINSQVLLKGCETAGYVIMSAARARILQRLHRPVWKECSIVSKTTWVGSLECMQYYATVDPGDANPSADNIQWLTVDNIEEKESLVIADPPDLVGSGQGVGGVVSNTVGGGSLAKNGEHGVQLQRIVSRCGCQFFYASYGDSVDPSCLEQVPPLPPEDSDLWKKDVAVDSFTLTHHDLNCCTNSLQYAMILDIVNNLLLYVEPRKKEAIERLQRMRFQLQLSSVEDQRRPIQQLQNNLRTLVSNLRRLERETYILDKSQDGNDVIAQQIKMLEQQMYETKVQINAQSEELAMMISCFKETQLSARQKMKMSQNHQVLLRRRNEVSFKHAQWRLTEADGQLGIADILLGNFLYSKMTKDDDAAQHLLELGYVKVTNLLPNQVYKDVLQPTGVKGSVPVDRQCALRVFCREKAPVGGISIKEHFEINVVPLTLRLTSQFFKSMMKFSFPERDTEKVDTEREDMDSDACSLSNTATRGSKRRTLQQRRPAGSEDRDDIDKMKERAENNKMFLYIKIPEVPVQVSYKGEKEKNIRDVNNFHLVLPTLEYHNVTWTWLDVLLAMKNDSKKALLSQAIKQKLQIKSNKISGTTAEDGGNGSGHVAQDEDKARLLLGSLLMGGKEKSSKSSFGKSGK